MRARLAWMLAATLIAAGCGDDTSGTDAGLDASSGTDAGTMDAGGSDSGTADAGSGAGDAGGTDAGGTDAGPPVDASATSITLSGAAVYANCMPSVPPDPILAFWTADVTGAPGSVSSIALTEAKLTITPGSGAPITQSLTIDNPSIAISGGAGTQMQRKTGADVTPTGACSTLCGGATFSLELTYDVAGTPFVVTETGSFGCVY